MPSKKQSTSLTTGSSYRGLIAIDSSPLKDLSLARQLLQRAIDEGQISSAACFAVAISKLIGPAAQHAIASNDLLSGPAAMRAADELIKILAQWAKDQNINDWHSVVDRITSRFSNEIKQ
jgi:hypothetical protein